MTDHLPERDDARGDARRLAARIRAGCLRKGWTLGELARRARISRTTLYHLERGRIVRPRAVTLSRIAAALEIDPRQLWSLESEPMQPLEQQIEAAHPDENDPSRLFDRRTNTAVAEVYRDAPDLFAGWQPEEWDELYSTFGTGGPLSPRGVAEAARGINRKRETVRQLQVVLETHLAEVAAGMVETLFQMVRPPGTSRPAEPAEGEMTNDEFPNVEGMPKPE